MGGRRMREDPWEFDPTHTLVLFTNHRPKIAGTDAAIWRRVRLIPWDVTIADDKKDEHLDKKLRKEAAGILNWIVAGARRYIAEGFTPPAAVKASTDRYRRDEDVVSRFIDDALELGAQHEARTVDLRSEMESWCREQGQPEPTVQQLTAALKGRGLKSRRTKSDNYASGGKKTTVWSGVRVKSE